MQYGYGNWLLVIGVNTVFLLFLFDVFKPKTPTDWRTFGSFAAFVIALFAEMYGFPLTIYFLASRFGSQFPQLNFTHASGHLWEVLLGNTGDPHVSIFHLISNLFIVGGILLIASAWKVLYQAVKKKTLATTGPYRYIRHPQYSGFILIIIGFLLQWPTLITLIMAPFLIFRYIRLASQEETYMLKTFGQSYIKYKKSAPGWWPSIKCMIGYKKGGEHHHET